MTRRSRFHPLGLASIFLLALLVALGALLSGSISLAQGTTIAGGSWSFSPGSTGNTAQITLTGVPSTGLGAADVSVAFDPAVLKITACDTGDLDGACNPNAPGGPAQAAGFKAPAITTDPVVVANLTVDCIGAAGTSSALTITVNELVDGTAGDPQPIAATTEAGSVSCGPTSVPSTGASPAGSSDTADWIIPVAASLAVAVLGLGALGAWMLRRRV